MGLFDQTAGTDHHCDPTSASRDHTASSYILSVTDLTKCIRGILEAEELFRDVWVRGEISNLTKHGSGHTYFSLKDQGALIRCVIWNSASRSRRPDIREGMRVIARGRISVYEKQGQYQLTVSEVTPDGLGALYVALEELKARLQAEGLFDAQHKKPIPRFPRRIAIVTSPTAAALRDMVTIAQRRMPSVHLVLVPALMQGDDSEHSIVESLRLADTATGADVIVLGRGGGSLEDLWSFNSESVARAVFACRTPVVSAIGHETDFSLSDFVADLRAPTPSAAMELVLPDSEELSARLDAILGGMTHSLQSKISQRQSNLERILGSVSLKYPERMLQNRWQELDTLEERLASSFRLTLSRSQGRFAEATAKLDSLSPLAVLSRGYTITRSAKDSAIVKRLSDVDPGDRIETLLSDGVAVSEITEIRKGWT